MYNVLQKTTHTTCFQFHRLRFCSHAPLLKAASCYPATLMSLDAWARVYFQKTFLTCEKCIFPSFLAHYERKILLSASPALSAAPAPSPTAPSQSKQISWCAREDDFAGVGNVAPLLARWIFEFCEASCSRSEMESVVLMWLKGPNKTVMTLLTACVADLSAAAGHSPPTPNTPSLHMFYINNRNSISVLLEDSGKLNRFTYCCSLENEGSSQEDDKYLLY